MQRDSIEYPGKVCRQATPLSVWGKAYRPTKQSPTIPSKTLIENCCWCLYSIVLCGFSNSKYACYGNLVCRSLRSLLLRRKAHGWYRGICTTLSKEPLALALTWNVRGYGSIRWGYFSAYNLTPAAPLPQAWPRIMYISAYSQSV